MYKINEIIIGEVKSITKTRVIVSTKDGWTGTVHIADISDYFVVNITFFVANKEKLLLKVIKINNEKKCLKLSYKSIMPRFLKNPFDYDLKETKNGFQNLKAHMQRSLKND